MGDLRLLNGTHTARHVVQSWSQSAHLPVMGGSRGVVTEDPRSPRVGGA